MYSLNEIQSNIQQVYNSSALCDIFHRTGFSLISAKEKTFWTSEIHEDVHKVYYTFGFFLRFAKMNHLFEMNHK